MEGQRVTIEELINQAESSCQPIPVFVDDKQIEVINVACLTSASEPGAEVDN